MRKIIKALLIKTCFICENNFETYKEERNCCSISCAKKHTWNLKLNSNIDRNTEKKCDVCDTKFMTYNKKAKCCSYSCARSKTWKNSDYKNNKIKSLKDVWTDEMKQKQSDFQKEHQNKPDVKLMMSKLQKVAQNKKGVNEKRSKKLKQLWNNIDYAEKNLKNGLKYKTFVLPSGKIVKLQGYEPIALIEILKTYSEDDIVIGVKEISKIIGKIIYIQNDKVHRYYPDFFLKSINTIIEVKSEWTYNVQKEKNELKKQASLDKGFNFNFMIL